ncbi:staygreen family protein [Cytobacillus gottheilii]|uniref:staygreen family protein n=1 Tax=Cytobacillus gottheilii TaxID=859144 RepID=UPI0009BBB41F|nr:staygreen family protein [Cytobacillus gottheilii]
MEMFNPSQLHVTYLPPATAFRPVERRKYTLTHSDETGELFLSIGHEYDVSSLNLNVRDELAAEWLPQLGQYVLAGKFHISNGDFDQQYAHARYLIFQREADRALSALIYGDREFFSHYPWLLDSPIYIYFESVYPEFHKMIYYGTPRQYLQKAADVVTAST